MDATSERNRYCDHQPAGSPILSFQDDQMKMFCEKCRQWVVWLTTADRQLARYENGRRRIPAETAGLAGPAYPNPLEVRR